MQANYVEPKIVLDEFPLHDHDLNMKSNNILVGRFLIQIFLVLDLQWCFHNVKGEKMDDFE